MKRLCRRLLASLLTWEANATRAEREQYEGTGAVGPIYLRNSHNRELQLRARARQLST